MADAFDRAALLRVRPAEYLKGGFRDGAGKVRGDLKGRDAFAVALQLVEGQASPQELAFTVEALKQTLPLQEGTPAERFADAVDEALGMVESMLDIETNHVVIESWLRAVVPFVQTDDDIAAFLEHAQAVLLQHGALVTTAYAPAPPP